MKIIINGIGEALILNSKIRLNTDWIYFDKSDTIYHNCKIKYSGSELLYDNKCCYCSQECPPFIILAAKLQVSTL